MGWDTEDFFLKLSFTCTHKTYIYIIYIYIYIYIYIDIDIGSQRHWFQPIKMEGAQSGSGINKLSSSESSSNAPSSPVNGVNEEVQDPKVGRQDLQVIIMIYL